jgi:hypothetical protein
MVLHFVDLQILQVKQQIGEQGQGEACAHEGEDDCDHG